MSRILYKTSLWAAWIVLGVGVIAGAGRFAATVHAAISDPDFRTFCLCMAFGVAVFASLIRIDLWLESDE